MRIFYSQPCGTCGRTMRIPIDLLGQQVTCPHCSAESVAADGNFSCRTISERAMPTINERVERLLATANESCTSNGHQNHGLELDCST